VLVVGLHADCGEGEVGAVDGNDAGLSKACAGIGFLNVGVYGDDGDADQEEEVDGDGGLVHGAARGGEEDVHYDCHSDGGHVHAGCAAHKDVAPGGRGGVVFNLGETVFCQCVGKIDEENQAEKEEEHGACKCDVVTPGNEEGVRDEKGDDDERDPSNDLGSPETILNRRTLVPCRSNTKQHESHKSMESAQSKVDPVHRNEAIAGLPIAAYIDIVKCCML